MCISQTNKSCHAFIYGLIVSFNVLHLKCCEEFIIGNAGSTISGYNLLSLTKLNDPAIKASLIHQYNQLQGLTVRIRWRPGNNCLVTSNANNYHGIKSNDRVLYLHQYEGVLKTPSWITTNSLLKIGDLEGRKKYDFGELTNTSCVINNSGIFGNPGIFGKNCGANKRVILKKPGIYNYSYKSSVTSSSLFPGAHAKYHIEFIIYGFTCYNPTITIKTSNHDYGHADTNKDILVTYIYGRNSSDMTQVTRCGYGSNTFCLASSKPGDLCNHYGQKTNRFTYCSRLWSCPQYYGGTYGFVITNGVNVGLQVCYRSMNVGFVLSCATNKETINNDASVTSYVDNIYVIYL